MEYFLKDRIKEKVSSLSLTRFVTKEEMYEASKQKAKDNLIDILLLCKEALYLSCSSSLEALIELVELRLDNFDKIKDLEKLKTTVASVVKLFGQSSIDPVEHFRTFNREFSKSKFSVVNYRNYLDLVEEDKRPLLPLMHQIKNRRSFNVMSYDPYDAWIQTKELNHESINNYGIFISNSKFCDENDVIKNAVFGIGSSSNISNGVFDVLLINIPSPILYNPIAKGIRNLIPHEESSLLGRIAKYLVADGLLILTLPYTRLDRELCDYLVRNYTHFQFDKLDEGVMIELRCQKQSAKEIDMDGYRLLRTIYAEIDKTHEWELYTLPTQISPIKNFRGSVVTPEMFEATIKNSRSFEGVSKKSTKTNRFSDHRPLLPFNIGQIGLLMASGFLDGVIEEEDGNAHLIKGRVERIVRSEQKGEVEEIVAYHSVQINALTPDGRIVKIQ